MQANIIDGLQSLVVPIDSVQLLEGNSMEHPDANIESLKKSLTQYGQRKPIVVNRLNNQIEAGNGTYTAAKALGWTHIAVVFVEDDPATETGYSIADNRTAQLSKWNFALLLEGLKRFDNPTSQVPGVDADFMSQVMAAHTLEKRITRRDPKTDVDKAGELQEKWNVQRGQLWIIPSNSVANGGHRLMCGDSTDPETASRVMADKKARLVVTDPPYGGNIGRVSATGGAAIPIENDELTGEELRTFLVAAFSAWGAYMDVHSAWYVWHPYGTQEVFKKALLDVNISPQQQIIWVKDNFVFSRQHYHWQHELCYYGWERGSMPEFFGGRDQSTTWHISRTAVRTREDSGHPTPKPTETFARPMRNSSRFGEIIIDPFSGSGPAYVAGETLGRLIYGAELKPEYVSVISERMVEMGLQPYVDTV